MRRPRDESSLVPRGPQSRKRDNLGFGSGNNAGLLLGPSGGTDRIELFCFRAQKETWLQALEACDSRQTWVLVGALGGKVTSPRGLTVPAGPPSAAPLVGSGESIAKAGIAISGVGAERLTGSRRHQLIRQRACTRQSRFMPWGAWLKRRRCAVTCDGNGFRQMDRWIQESGQVAVARRSLDQFCFSTVAFRADMGHGYSGRCVGVWWVGGLVGWWSAILSTITAHAWQWLVVAAVAAAAMAAMAAMAAVGRGRRDGRSCMAIRRASVGGHETGPAHWGWEQRAVEPSGSGMVGAADWPGQAATPVRGGYTIREAAVPSSPGLKAV
ncbi:hypothetical protein AOQ84DRAFT_376101 [Glonium stellatum]|uniref:Uncharacterized protein n=1 Tax=Glonium stellatum TaxID=574774 RepID=A0A8E2F2L8_9PEZI|nr:hypothetical protein AOQ84DRAFT_376101 [Glonium stellatum]